MSPLCACPSSREARTGSLHTHPLERKQKKREKPAPSSEAFLQIKEAYVERKEARRGPQERAGGRSRKRRKTHPGPFAQPHSELSRPLGDLKSLINYPFITL